MNNIKFGKDRRKSRVRHNMLGTQERPRLSAFVSNKKIYIQAIDDVNHKTLAAASSDGKSKNIESAKKVGQEFGESLKKVKVEKAIFDRGSKKYHGRVKALADAIREKGISF